jgi:succinate dehydrogenase / fumarate reductase iron-sulfur subunit
MNLTLKIWRQLNATATGKFVTYQAKDVTRDMSFLEMLDALDEDLLNRGSLPWPLNTTAARVSAAHAAS